MTDEPQDPSRSNRLGPALLWAYALSFGRFGIGGALTFVLAAILDPRSFGVMFMAMVWVSFVLMLTQHATLPVVQQPDLEDRHFSAAFWAMLAGSVVVCGLVIVVAPAVAAANRTPELTEVLRALAPMIIIEAASAVPGAVLRRRMDFRGLAIRGTVSTAVGGVVGVVLAILGFGVWALVAQTLTAAVVYATMLWAARPWTPRWHPMRAELREMRGTAVKSVSGFFGYFVALRSDALLLGFLFGPVTVGLYRLATRFTQMVTDLASAALTQVSLPDLATVHRDPAQFMSRLTQYAHVNAVLAFPLLGLVAATAEPAVAIIGPEWAPATGPLRVLCVAGGLWALFSLLCSALMAAQRPGIEAAFNWVRAGVNAGAITTAALLSRGSSLPARITSIAWAVLAVEIVMLLVIWYATFSRVLRWTSLPLLRVMVPAAGAGVAAAVAGWGTLRLIPDDTALVAAFLVSATAAGVCAVLVLTTDARLVRRIRALRDRRRHAKVLSLVGAAESEQAR